MPDSFNIGCFEPKNWEGLGSIEGAGPVLVAIKQQVTEAVAPKIELPHLMGAVDELTYVFRQELATANEQIGLRPSEFDFAVSGFNDVIQAVAYRLVQLAHTYPDNSARIQDEFDFSEVYQTWLNDSTGVFSTVHVYDHDGARFEVRMVYNAYGRVGLQVQVSDEVYYVVDMTMACPASNYMRDLYGDVAKALCEAVIG